MQVKVLFFGMLKDVLGREADQLTLREGATLADLLVHYESGAPRLRDYLPSLALSINQEYASPADPLRDQDEVALLPPVSGGAKDPWAARPEEEPAGVEVPALQSEHAAIVREPIDVGFISERLRRPPDGAVLVFEGVVRDHTRNRTALFLDYEAYEPMALARMESLAGDALQRFAVRDVAIVHRLGRLDVGETSVVIAVASAHRAAAFEACRWLIDTLKQTVPIWKKEYFEDGAVWAPGEPFPEFISTAGREPASTAAGSGSGARRSDKQ
jgi:MoaE-MoaD fusion protein